MWQRRLLSQPFWLAWLVGLGLGWGASPEAQAQDSLLFVCPLESYQPINGHAIWLDNLPGAPSPRFNFDAQGGLLEIYDDSTAHITGRVVHESLPNWQWDLDMHLINGRTYAQWTALGRDIKIELAPPSLVNAFKSDWLIFELDSVTSRLYGVPGTFYDGDTLVLKHNPPNFEFGFQLGLAANAKNGDFGISGWFLYEGSGLSGHGDINASTQCQTFFCDLAVDNHSVQCVTDSTYEVTVTLSGSAISYEITDDQGSAPLSNVGAGTYTFGPYPHLTPVTISVTDLLTPSCDTAFVVSPPDCTPPPVCDLKIDSVEVQCVNSTHFQVLLTFSGSGSAYTLSDNLGNPPLTGQTPGTYTFGPYPNNSQVTITVTDEADPTCTRSSCLVVGDCAPLCNVQLDSLATNCLTDSTFELVVGFSGSGLSYTLADNQGSVPLQNATPGLYTFGPYATGSLVSVTVTDNFLPGCTFTTPVLTADCDSVVVPPVCAVQIDTFYTTCIGGPNFELTLSFSGTGQTFTLSDNQGGQPLVNVPAGSYTFGPFGNLTPVVITITDSADATCQVVSPVITDSCFCDVAIDTLFSLCVSDTSFAAVVTFSGTGSSFIIQDDQNSAPLPGLSPGTYTYSDYFNSTEVMVTIVDPNFSNCEATAGPITADCTPVPICDIALDTLYTTCLTDSTFEVVFAFTGSGTDYGITDNQGTITLSGLTPGTYTFGNYPNNAPVSVFLADPNIFGCFQGFGPVTADCDTTQENDLCVDAEPLTCGMQVTGSTVGATSQDFGSGCGKLPGPGVWYRINGTGERMTITSCGQPGTGPTLTLYKGDCSDRRCAIDHWRNDICADGNREITFPTAPGTPYLLYVSHLTGDPQPFTLEVSCAPIAPRVRPPYPNPSPGIFEYEVVSPEAQAMRWEVVDVQGQVIQQGSKWIMAGYHLERVNLEGAGRGMYLLRCIMGSGEVVTHKLSVMP